MYFPVVSNTMKNAARNRVGSLLRTFNAGESIPAAIEFGGFTFSVAEFLEKAIPVTPEFAEMEPAPVMQAGLTTGNPGSLGGQALALLDGLRRAGAFQGEDAAKASAAAEAKRRQDAATQAEDARIRAEALGTLKPSPFAPDKAPSYVPTAVGVKWNAEGTAMVPRYASAEDERIAAEIAARAAPQPPRPTPPAATLDEIIGPEVDELPTLAPISVAEQRAAHVAARKAARSARAG